MKKLLITFLLVLFSIPVFSFGFEVDAYLGESNGASAGVVFGAGKITNFVGVLFDTHEYTKEERGQYSSYSYRITTKTIKERAYDFGPFYKMDFSQDFVNIGKIKIGMDIGAQVAATIDSGILLAIIPSAKVSIAQFDITAGYRGTVYMADIIQKYTSSPYTSAGSIGVRYRFRDRNNYQTLDYIDSSSNPYVIKHGNIY